MDPTVELVLQPPVAGMDPFATLLVAMGALWVFGSPWVRLCWWLGTRARQPRPA